VGLDREGRGAEPLSEEGNTRREGKDEFLLLSREEVLSLREERGESPKKKETNRKKRRGPFMVEEASSDPETGALGKKKVLENERKKRGLSSEQFAVALSQEKRGTMLGKKIRLP